MVRHGRDSVGVWFRVIATAALASQIYLNVWQGQRLDRLQMLLLLVSLLCGLASVRPVRRALAAALADSRRKSPLIEPKLGRDFRFWMLWALWFATVTSLGEMAYLTYTKEVTRYRVLGFEFMWRIPLGYALVFLVVVCLCWVAARRYPKPMRVLFVASVFVTTSGWIPIIFKNLHDAAILVLAAGIAVQLARMAANHTYLVHRLVRRTVAPAVVSTLTMSVGFYGWGLLREQDAISHLPPTAAPAPNVLLIVLDTVRAKSLSLYGYHRNTSPNLDRFATRGAVFNRAYSTAPWTLPSHASMFTGRLPHELSAGHNTPLDATHPTLAEALTANGYLTTAVVANMWVGGAPWGLSRGFLHYEDQSTTPMTSFLNTSFGDVLMDAGNIRDHFATGDNFGRKSAEDVNRSFVDWLSRRGPERPFFAFLNYCDAHSPYVPPEPFALKFAKTRPRGNVDAKDYAAWSPAEVQELNDAYDGAIAYLDHQLGRLFDALQSQGTLKNTIVIVTSDHGEQFGEHNLLEHSNSLYVPLLHVPLVIVYPDYVPAGARIDEPVSLRNLPATVFELTGLRDPVGFPGTPVLPRRAADGPVEEGAIVLAEVEPVSDTSLPAWYPARRGRMKSVLFRDWQYIRNFGDGQEELFDLQSDPGTMRDLSKVEDRRLREYRGHLESVLSASERERIRARGIKNR